MVQIRVTGLTILVMQTQALGWEIMASWLVLVFPLVAAFRDIATILLSPS